MNKRKYKRRQYIVDPEFQYGMVRKFAVLAVLFIAMSMSFLILVNYLYGDLQFELVQPDPFSAEESMDTLDGQRSLLDLLWPVLAVCLGVTLAVTFVLGILLSHRMAGPIFRIRRTILEMAEGDLKGLIFLRNKDDFKPLAEAMNILKESLWSTFRELNEVCGQFESGGDAEKQESLERFQGVLAKYHID